MTKRKTREEREIDVVLCRLSDGPWLRTLESIELAYFLERVHKCHCTLYSQLVQRGAISPTSVSSPETHTSAGGCNG